MRVALEMARRNLMAWNTIGWQNGGVSKAQADELNKLYEWSPEIRAIDAALATSPRVAWLVTAWEIVETLQRLVEYDDAEQDKTGLHEPDCGCAYCAARALLVKAWAGR